MSRRRSRLLAGLALVALGGAALSVRCWLRRESPIDVPLARDFRLGYNLDFPGDWTSLPPFIDNFKNARGFQGSCSARDPECHPTAHLDLDAQGWVKSLRYRDDPARAYDRVEVIVNTSTERYDIGEPFAVTWSGQGQVEVFGSDDAARDPVRARINFTLPRGILVLRLAAIDPAQTGDYLRDIRVFRAAHEGALRAGDVYNPDLLAYLAPFRSLRFMDWMLSNAAGRCSGGSKDGQACYAVSNEICEGGGRCVMPGKWSERPTPDQAVWFSSGQFLDPARPEQGSKVGGYPLEVMVGLANAAKASPHFNMPADSDDEYVLEFARRVKQELSPELPLSVEYSNEVWNWTFPQARYAKIRGERLWPGDGTAWVQYMAARTRNMCALFHQVFADDEGRLRCLISPQTGWRELAETVLDCPAWVGQHPEDESCIKDVDAINITGYFAGCLPSHPDIVRRWVAELGPEGALGRAFEQLEHGGLIEACEGEAVDSLDHAIDTYRYFMQLAARRGLALEVYEGGTHFDLGGERGGQADPAQQLLLSMTRDERMYRLYSRNYDSFRQAGGSSFNVWGWVARDDLWANADSPIELEHPKYRAIRDFARRLREPASELASPAR
ncbi:MAG TPA: hypothetical protein VNN80_36440 [Polyangiaceae bacterium]|nr:hypothetical protein [Polyangiaceae bacterium]